MFAKLTWKEVLWYTWSFRVQEREQDLLACWQLHHQQEVQIPAICHLCDHLIEQSRVIRKLELRKRERMKYQYNCVTITITPSASMKQESESKPFVNQSIDKNDNVELTVHHKYNVDNSFHFIIKLHTILHLLCIEWVSKKWWNNTQDYVSKSNLDDMALWWEC